MGQHPRLGAGSLMLKLHVQVGIHIGCPLEAHTRGLLSVAFSPCGERLATRSRDGSVIVWSVQTGQVQQRMPGMAGCADSVTLSAAGTRLAFGDRECNFCVWAMGFGRGTRTRVQKDATRWGEARLDGCDTTQISRDRRSALGVLVTHRRQEACNRGSRRMD